MQAGLCHPHVITSYSIHYTKLYDLTSIIAANLAGGLLSVLAAALVAFAVLERWVPRLVSFAVGALLGAALLNLLPEALESSRNNFV